MSNTLKRFGSNIGKIGFSGLEQTNNIVNATGETATDVIKVPGAFASTANKGFETANTTLDIAQKLGIASSDATTQILQQGVKITEGVSKNADTALLTTNTLLQTGNDTLQHISPHIAKTSGNAGEISSSLSGLAVNAVNTSAYLTDTLFVVIKYPFQLARTETNPRKKIETSFKLIRRKLTELFGKDLKSIISLCDISIKSFQTQKCKRTRFFSLNCGDSQYTIDSMKRIKKELEFKLKEFQGELNSIFKSFTTEMETVSSENLVKEADEIKIGVVTKAIELFNACKTIFNEKLASIKSPLTKLFEENERRLRGITEEQSEQSEQSEELRKPEELEGGKKQKRKRKTKRNKSHRKHRTVKRV
jgi:hypothetical protein